MIQLTMENVMEVQATKVIDWVDANLPPLSWRILAMKLMKLLMTHKIFAARIDEKTLFNEEIINALRETIKSDYGKDMPDFS